MQPKISTKAMKPESPPRHPRQPKKSSGSPNFLLVTGSPLLFRRGVDTFDRSEIKRRVTNMSPQSEQNSSPPNHLSSKPLVAMKQLITFSAIAAIAASGSVSAQTPAYSKPSGYVTETLKGDGAFNLIGLTLQQPPLATGSLTAISTGKVSDTKNNFTTLLTAGQTYILQFKSGAQIGGVQVVTQWGTASGNTVNDLVVTDNVGAMGVIVGDTYEVRPAATLSSIFGATNQAGLKSGDLFTADVIWLPTGAGGFAKFYYSQGSAFPPVAAGWKNSSGGSANNEPVLYTESMFIQRRGAGDLQVVFTGQVQTAVTQVFAETGVFNYITSVFPVGTTLGTSGLESSLKSGDLFSADVLWMQKADRTGYDKFYYTQGSAFPPVAAGWKDSAGASATTQPLTSGMIIQRRGLTNIAPKITPPSSYSTL
jgi:hypothetical protein